MSQDHTQDPADRSDVTSEMEVVNYDDAHVKWFVFFTVFWGIVGMLAGVYIALQFTFHQLNFDVPQLTFGRLRPLHTNAVIFAFAGNSFFAGCYYSVQRLCRVRTWSNKFTKFHLWGWQSIIVLDAVCLLSGITDGKEYAEPVWWLDLLIAVVWVVAMVNVVMTCLTRKEKHLYAAIWFYLASFITVALLHVVNNLAIPVSWTKSYHIWSGVQDALIQWWYGHNAVAFFLTTPFLGLMYYFLPKAAKLPVYSYKLSILHFWSLIFIYIWAGPHHLLYTPLPDWAQTLGMVFSLMLIAPSWGGMINGFLTIKPAWKQLMEDPIIKFFVWGLTFYGMATFEGPLLSIKSVSALGHFTDWIVGHVHGGALGWVGFMTFAMLYWMVPRLWNTKLYSVKLCNFHFWIATVGIFVYMISMMVAGITQGLQWRTFTENGTLAYTFMETVVTLKPYFIARSIGGAMYLAGTVVMAYNLWQTVQNAGSNPAEKEA